MFKKLLEKVFPKKKSACQAQSCCAKSKQKELETLKEELRLLQEYMNSTHDL